MGFDKMEKEGKGFNSTTPAYEIKEKKVEPAANPVKEQAKVQQKEQPKKSGWGGFKGILDSLKSDNVFKDNEA